MPKAKLGFILIGLLVLTCTQKGWHPLESKLVTRWGEQLSPDHVWPEYPRPMLQREHWLNLNGLWDYVILPADSSKPEKFMGKILVPFPVESALSGVGKRLSASQRIWYRKIVKIPSFWKTKRVLLHFEAVDWQADVWVNGKKVGQHRGGYDPFTFEISKLAHDTRELEILVKVYDPTDKGYQARGKQVSNPGGIWYTPSSGIWQTVWLEAVPEVYIRELFIVPNVDSSLAFVRAVVDPPDSDAIVCVITAYDQDGREVASQRGKPGDTIALRFEVPHLWSPEDPYLYDLTLRLYREHKMLDEVKSYLGLRKIAVGKDEQGISRMMLNNRFVFQLGPLDQGFWPDGLYTPPSEEAMRYDLEMIKKFGFNMLRKHVKIEPRRFYYWCDRLGLLVWQDMPSASRPRADEVASDELHARDLQFEFELKEMVHTLFNHPSIIMWVLFNEGWGQYDTPRLVSWLKKLDSTRLIDNASGWTDKKIGDVIDLHRYPGPASPVPETDRAAVLGEFGGLGLVIPGHTWKKSGWGYDLLKNRDHLMVRYEDLLAEVFRLRDNPGLSAAVYTQITDVETENNGLLTYDRTVHKIDPDGLRLANHGYFPPKLDMTATIFVDSGLVRLSSVAPEAEIVFTLDGTEPGEQSEKFSSPFWVKIATMIKAKTIWPDGQESRVATFKVEQVQPKPAQTVTSAKPGIRCSIYNGSWENLPDFSLLKADSICVLPNVGLPPGKREDYALQFDGLIRVPHTGVYRFALTSDDGSRLFVDDTLVVDNDGVHGSRMKSGAIALQGGFHTLKILFFQRKGGQKLQLMFSWENNKATEIPPQWLFHK